MCPKESSTSLFNMKVFLKLTLLGQVVESTERLLESFHIFSEEVRSSKKRQKALLFLFTVVPGSWRTRKYLPFKELGNSSDRPHLFAQNSRGLPSSQHLLGRLLPKY